MVYRDLLFGLWCKFYLFEAKFLESRREVIKENSTICQGCQNSTQMQHVVE